MSQSRRRSFFEALLSTLTGGLGGWAIAYFILLYSPYGVAVTTSLICSAWTLWGLGRGYAYRRLFNRGEVVRPQSLPEDLRRIDRLTRQRDSARRACGQASFALRELLPDHPDVRMTIEMIERALTPSTSTGVPEHKGGASSTADGGQIAIDQVDSDHDLPLNVATTVLLE